MKKLCVVYSNCQGDGLIHFLKKTRMGRDYEFVIWHNWQLMMGEQDTEDFRGCIAGLGKCGGVFIYQPTAGYPDKQGRPVPSTQELFAGPLLLSDVKGISFAYQFNHGFFPIVNMGNGYEGWISSPEVKFRAATTKGDQWLKSELIKDYFAGKLRFDCGRRFIECLAEQSRRERDVDLKMVPFILSSYKKHRLFLTYNHPTSPFFAYLAALVLEKVYGECKDLDILLMQTPDDNECQMNGVQPVHPAVVHELGLEYAPTDNAMEYYQAFLESLILVKQL